MSGLSSDVGWDEPEDRPWPERAGTSALLAAAGLSWGALCAASALAGLLCLAFRSRDRAPARLERASGEHR